MATCGIGLYLRAARAIRLPEFSQKCNFLIRMWFGIVLKIVQKLFNYNRHLFSRRGTAKYGDHELGFVSESLALHSKVVLLMCCAHGQPLNVTCRNVYFILCRRAAALLQGSQMFIKTANWFIAQIFGEWIGGICLFRSFLTCMTYLWKCGSLGIESSFPWHDRVKRP